MYYVYSEYLCSFVEERYVATFCLLVFIVLFGTGECAHVITCAEGQRHGEREREGVSLLSVSAVYMASLVNFLR